MFIFSILNFNISVHKHALNCFHNFIGQKCFAKETQTKFSFLVKFYYWTRVIFEEIEKHTNLISKK